MVKKNSYAAKNSIHPVEKCILLTVRVLLAVVFIFSGFVKAVDPLGTAYKFQEYFMSFGEPFIRFDFLALPLAVALITLELWIGLSLLFKVYNKAAATFALLFMCVMTPLTLYVYLFNPVTDCGCFGDFLILSNSATFWKNIVLLAFSIYIFVRRKHLRPLFLPTVETISAILFVVVGIGICIYSYTYLPLFDFRPYKIGTNIQQEMEIPEGAAHDVYETAFVYEKDGVKKGFTLQNYPKDDSTWVFVDQKTTLISKGYVPKIHDFSITHEDFGDITQEVLDYQGKTYLLVMYNLDKTSLRGVQIAEKFYKQIKDKSIHFYALTGSGQDEMEKFKRDNNLTFPFCETDATALKTMIRANPGLVLIENGTVKGMWSWRSIY
jgi:uncharacterized membrane protein YphA (DoxX/SURF4 family)